MFYTTEHLKFLHRFSYNKENEIDDFHWLQIKNMHSGCINHIAYLASMDGQVVSNRWWPVINFYL